MEETPNGFSLDSAVSVFLHCTHRKPAETTVGTEQFHIDVAAEAVDPGESGETANNPSLVPGGAPAGGPLLETGGERVEAEPGGDDADREGVSKAAHLLPIGPEPPAERGEPQRVDTAVPGIEERAREGCGVLTACGSEPDAEVEGRVGLNVRW